MKGFVMMTNNRSFSILLSILLSSFALIACGEKGDTGERCVYGPDEDGDTFGAPIDCIGSCSGGSVAFNSDHSSDDPALRSYQRCTTSEGKEYIYMEDGRPEDCDDSNARINVDWPEVCDGVDNDCDGTIDEDDATDAKTWYFDGDYDGYGGAFNTIACTAPTGYVADNTDCNDSDAAIFPAATETCNGLDDDCDGEADEDVKSAFYVDTDTDTFGDSFSAAVETCTAPTGYVADNTDCDDTDAAINPGATEIWYDGVDQDCAGNDDYDQDADGYLNDANSDVDCDDTDAAINPGATEIWYDGVDQDCAGNDDYDADGDDYVSADHGGTDCLDEGVSEGGVIAENINPGMTEDWYNGIDENCDGNDCDKDWDGYCIAGYEHGTTGFKEGDCNDSDSAINPGASEKPGDEDDENCDGVIDDGSSVEICDDIDNDGDGAIDEDGAADASVWYVDSDGDDYGNASVASVACAAPTGYVSNSTDCDDTDPDINPGATETDCTDPTDYNCDGVTGYSDNDGDGFPACEECDDTNAAINPDVDEYCDGVDNNCDGVIDEDDATDAKTWYFDGDYDGYGGAFNTIACTAPTGYVADNTDCDDSDSGSYPGADEIVGDQVDEDCDGTEICYFDNDDDGYLDTSGVTETSTDVFCTDPFEGLAVDPFTDCDDTDAAINPGAIENDCADPTDYNCDGLTGYDDNDGDGFPACEECDDTNAATNPSADESCDGVDNNCDGVIDEDGATDAETWYRDSDGDGFGRAASSTTACTAPTGYVADNTDCNDSSAGVYPSADEYCDSVDNDCDGATDEDAVNVTVWYADSDGDGSGDPDVEVFACDQPLDYVGNANDCNDTTPDANPDADEVCDGIDNDCDSTVDEEGSIDATVWRRDADADGYGDAGEVVWECEQPSGYVGGNGDCDDSDALINPAATETCDGIDNDCDGTVDDGTGSPSTFYADSDGDGYGNPVFTTAACAPPPGYVVNNTDCDDTDAGVNPSTTWYVDSDGDGYGNVSISTTACEMPSGYVSDPSDCDDSNTDVYPGADEYCDFADNDCDGTTDESDAIDASTWYADNDGDGYGSASTVVACDPKPSGTSDHDSDCDDTNAAVNPGVTEVVGDSVDNDCDGAIDEDSSTDVDGDGYSEDAGDCDDSDDLTYPSADEICDSVDNDCDGDVDEGATLTAGELTEGDFVITEVMANVSATKAWFEVYVAATCPVEVDASGGVLFGGSSTEPPQQVFYSAFTAAPGDFLLVVANAGGWSSYDGEFDSSLKLSPASDTLWIETSTRTIIDEATWSAATGFPSISSGFSMKLDDGRLNSADNDFGTNWCQASAADTYTSGYHGTPRAENGICP